MVLRLSWFVLGPSFLVLGPSEVRQHSPSWFLIHDGTKDRGRTRNQELSTKDQRALAVLVRVTEGDVPVLRLIVESARHLHGIELHRHFHVRLHPEVAVAAQ